MIKEESKVKLLSYSTFEGLSPEYIAVFCNRLLTHDIDIDNLEKELLLLNLRKEITKILKNGKRLLGQINFTFYVECVNSYVKQLLMNEIVEYLNIDGIRLVFTLNGNDLMSFIEKNSCVKKDSSIVAIADKILDATLEVAPNLFMNAAPKCLECGLDCKKPKRLLQMKRLNG